jgi:hypothetical protein
MQEEFIKKGVIQSEQEGPAVKTASDDLVESSKGKMKPCCKACRCQQKAAPEGTEDASRRE